nr:antibiotic biosynthesis monooxygenase [Parvularcula dongshanensis]
MTVAPNDIEAARAALPEHIRLSRAEPGCLAFEVEEREEGVFFVREAFEDEVAFAAHQARVPGTPWAKATERGERNYRRWSD